MDPSWRRRRIGIEAEHPGKLLGGPLAPESVVSRRWVRPDRNASCRGHRASTSVRGTAFQGSGSRKGLGIPRGIRRRVEQPQSDGASHRILTGMDIKMAQDAGDVRINGAPTDEEEFPNLAVRLPVS